MKDKFTVRRYKRRILAAVLLLSGLAVCMPTSVSAAESRAVSVSQYDTDEAERVEVSVKGGYIYITTTRPLTIRLYSILGQLVAQQAIQSGTTRIKAPSRGVYILKAGGVTRRVTIN